jgi:hypothetical protein
VLTEGIDWLGAALLCGLYVVFAVWAMRLFQRRDIGVASQGLRLPWRRRHLTEAAAAT